MTIPTSLARFLAWLSRKSAWVAATFSLVFGVCSVVAHEVLENPRTLLLTVGMAAWVIVLACCSYVLVAKPLATRRERSVAMTCVLACGGLAGAEVAFLMLPRAMGWLYLERSSDGSLRARSDRGFDGPGVRLEWRGDVLSIAHEQERNRVDAYVQLDEADRLYCIASGVQDGEARDLMKFEADGELLFIRTGGVDRTPAWLALTDGGD